MTPDGLAALAEVRIFLAREVLPLVPATVAGELRAAIKILEAASEELNALHPLLHSECRELLALGEEADRVLRVSDSGHAGSVPLALLAPRLLAEDLDTRGLLGLHEEVLDASSALVAALQRHVRATPRAEDAGYVLLRFYETLGRHAAGRVSWQSVFPRFCAES